HTRFSRDWSSDVCSSDLTPATDSPESPPSLPAAVRRCVAHIPLPPEPVRLSDPASRWASVVSAPDALLPPVPCTLATTLPDMRAASCLVPLIPNLRFHIGCV